MDGGPRGNLFIEKTRGARRVRRDLKKYFDFFACGPADYHALRRPGHRDRKHHVKDTANWGPASQTI